MNYTVRVTKIHLFLDKFLRRDRTTGRTFLSVKGKLHVFETKREIERDKTTRELVTY